MSDRRRRSKRPRPSDPSDESNPYIEFLLYMAADHNPVRAGLPADYMPDPQAVRDYLWDADKEPSPYEQARARILYSPRWARERIADNYRYALHPLRSEREVDHRYRNPLRYPLDRIAAADALTLSDVDIAAVFLATAGLATPDDPLVRDARTVMEGMMQEREQASPQRRAAIDGALAEGRVGDGYLRGHRIRESWQRGDGRWEELPDELWDRVLRMAAEPRRGALDPGESFLSGLEEMGPSTRLQYLSRIDRRSRRLAVDAMADQAEAAIPRSLAALVNLMEWLKVGLGFRAALRAFLLDPTLDNAQALARADRAEIGWPLAGHGDGLYRALRHIERLGRTFRPRASDALATLAAYANTARVGMTGAVARLVETRRPADALALAEAALARADEAPPGTDREDLRTIARLARRAASELGGGGAATEPPRP